MLKKLQCVCCCLIPQDVNPQLKGHLKGALNNGGTKEELNDVRSLVFDLCDWKGGITWKGGKKVLQNYNLEIVISINKTEEILNLFFSLYSYNCSL